jgi:hypothetical protein
MPPTPATITTRAIHIFSGTGGCGEDVWWFQALVGVPLSFLRARYVDDAVPTRMNPNDLSWCCPQFFQGAEGTASPKTWRMLARVSAQSTRHHRDEGDDDDHPMAPLKRVNDGTGKE